MNTEEGYYIEHLNSIMSEKDIFEDKLKLKKQQDIDELRELGLYNPDKNDHSKEIDESRFTGDESSFFKRNKYKQRIKVKFIKQVNDIENYPGEFSNDDELYRKSEDLLKIQYGDESVNIIKCVKCNGRSFNVGRACYFTAIRCINCGWEKSIHEG